MQETLYYAWSRIKKKVHHEQLKGSRERRSIDDLMFDVTNVVFDLFLLLLFCCQGTTLGDGEAIVSCIVDPSVLTSFLGGKDFEDLAWPMVYLKIF